MTKNLIQRSLALWFCSLSLFSMAQHEHFLLGYYDYTPYGGEPSQYIFQLYKDLEENHFNCALIDYYLMLPDFRFTSSYPSTDFLDSAAHHHIGVILTTPENCALFRKPSVGPVLLNQSDSTRSQGLSYYGSHPAVMGLNIMDEPHRDYFSHIIPHAQSIRDFDPMLLRFVNLLPTYGSDRISSFYEGIPFPEYYEQYIQDYIDSARPNVLSFDHYPLFFYSPDPNGVYWPGDLFYNLDIMARKSVENEIPYIYVLSSLDQRRNVIPTAATAYFMQSGLFYGAKGLLHWNSSKALENFPEDHVDMLKDIHGNISEQEDILLSLQFKSAYHKSFKSTIGVGNEQIPEHSA